MKVYIAGKITGNENNKAEFAEAEKKLRALGHIPLNPAVLPEGMEKADYMRICLAMMDSADAIALMLNWTGSPGANIELSLAIYTGKKQIDNRASASRGAGGRSGDRMGMRSPEGPCGEGSPLLLRFLLPTSCSL